MVEARREANCPSWKEVAAQVALIVAGLGAAASRSEALALTGVVLFLAGLTGIPIVSLLRRK